MIINNTKIARATLYIFMFSINFEMLSLAGNSDSLAVGKITGFLYFGVLLYQRIRFDIYPYKNVLYPLVLFFLVITLSSAIHLNYYSIEIFNISIIQNMVLFFLLLIHERKDPGVLEKSLYAFALGTVLLSIFYLFGIGVEYEYGRLTLFGDDQNYIGLRMGIASIILIYLVFMSGKSFSLMRLLLIMPIPVLLTVMIKSGSRLSFITYVLMMLVLIAFYFMTNPGKRIVVAFMYVGLFIFVLMPLFLSNTLLMERLTAAKQGDLSGRDYIWEAYLHKVWESPVIGYGFSGFMEIGINTFGGYISAHNVILEVLLYGGFIALLAYVWFIFRVLYYGFRRYLSEKEYIGLVLMISYIGSVLSMQVLVTKLMWFILAFNCILLSHIRLKNKNMYTNQAGGDLLTR